MTNPTNPTRDKTPTMQVIRLTTTDGVSHEFFGPSLLRKEQDPGQEGQPTMLYIKSVDFGPELTLQEVQEILAQQSSMQDTYPTLFN